MIAKLNQRAQEEQIEFDIKENESKEKGNWELGFKQNDFGSVYIVP